MSITSKIRKILGFSDAEVEDELNRDDLGRDATVTPLSQRRKNAEDVARSNQPADSDAETSPDSSAANDSPIGMPDFPEALPQEIFQTVVKIFNESLPQFVRQSVDEKAQQKYIYDALDDSMKAYIKSLSDIAARRTEMMYEADRNRLNREMQSIKEKSKRVADTSAEMKEQKLSAERQKRALTERVHDLEQQIDTLLAEKEQFELENKSLANKLRVVSTRQGEEAEATSNPDSEARIAELTSKLDEANSQLQKYVSDIDTLKKRCEMADTMINDLNHKASAANASKAENDNLHSQLAETASLAEKLKEENDSLSEKLRLAAQQLETKDEELQIANDEIEESQSSLKLFEEALDKFEAVKKNKDEQIANLQAKVESLNATIENNLKLQIESENALRSEIDALKRSPRTAQHETPSKKSTKSISLDESFDDINWLISTPPEGTNARTSGLTDEEFGYQEPRRTKSTDDPAQMSLF